MFYCDTPELQLGCCTATGSISWSTSRIPPRRPKNPAPATKQQRDKGRCQRKSEAHGTSTLAPLTRVCTCCPNNVDRMRGTDLAAAQENPPGVPLREDCPQQAARDGPHLHAHTMAILAINRSRKQRYLSRTFTAGAVREAV